jgi:sigma-B regulation protein RsbU (phosphoserine phosphatase)
MLALNNREINKSKIMRGPWTTFFLTILIFAAIMFSIEWIAGESIKFNLKYINGFLDIGMAFALMLIYNTTYYSFITTRKTKVLVYSLAFLGGAVMDLLSFILVVYSNIYDLANTLKLGLLVGNLNLFILFAILIWVETRVSEESIAGDSKRIYTLIPLVIPMIIILLTVYFNYSIHYSSLAYYVELIGIAISYMICLELIFLMLLSMRQYYSNHNENYIKMISAYIFYFNAILFGNFMGSYGQCTYFFTNLYQVVAAGILLKYTYRLYIGNPLKDIQQREEQVHVFAKNIETVIRKKTNEVNEINKQFLVELEYARSIQQSLLPPRKLVIKNTHFISEYFPCDKLSGDFYDIYKIDDETIGMYILDVSGHGISAALMTMFCNNYIRSTERLIMRFRGLKPHKNLANFFEEFNKMNFPDEMHMVVFFASYNMTTKVLTYCSGGMNCIPIVVSEDGSITYLDESEGFAICKLHGIYTPEYISSNIQLKPGDRVLFYTDGLVDKEKNQVFTQSELEQTLKEGVHLSLTQLNERLISKVYPYNSNLEDDITYFIMEI